MPRRGDKYVPRCDLCGRMMNDSSFLTHLRKPGVLEPLRICSAGRCWKEAAERGYSSSHAAT